MVRIGWIQDTHTQSDGISGAQEALISDYNYLVDEIGVDTIYHGGDVCHSDGKIEPPHVRAAAYERFFELVSQTTAPDALSRLVPGNHDVPLSTFVQADERCVLRDRIDYPDEKLTVLFLNTQAPGFVTGSASPTGGQGGVGTEVCRVPYRDVLWIEEQLADAEAAGHATLIVPHAALTFLPECPYHRVHAHKGAIDAATLYNVVTNHRRVHGVISEYSNVVVLVSHLFQFEGEGSQTIDGVHYVYKKHYWNAGDPFETFCHLEMDGSGTTITSVEHSDRSSSVLLDVTF